MTDPRPMSDVPAEALALVEAILRECGEPYALVRYPRSQQQERLARCADLLAARPAPASPAPVAGEERDRITGIIMRHLDATDENGEAGEFHIVRCILEEIAAETGEPGYWQDKAEGLSADLDSAVEVAWKRGATEWVKLNYPATAERLAAQPIPDEEARMRAGEALRECIAVIEDYVAYTHDGDPDREDARLMGEMEINRFARDGRLEAARLAARAQNGEPSR